VRFVVAGGGSSRRIGRYVALAFGVEVVEHEIDLGGGQLARRGEHAPDYVARSAQPVASVGYAVPRERGV
jgi:hypothetical protein